MTTAAITAAQLSRNFRGTKALQQLDLVVPQGAIYALVGSNGAGKTTLIKTLLNILKPTTGAATLLGIPSTELAGKPFQHIGYVSENQELPTWMTVSYFLNYLRPFYPTWDTALEARLLRQFDLPPKRKLKALSRGMQMKAALLSVLSFHPTLILLDEPFSGLDPLVRDELVDGLLQTVQEGKTTILLSSHDLAEIESFATHVGFLDNGRMLFSEEMPSLSARFREVEVTLNLSGESEMHFEMHPAQSPQTLSSRSAAEGSAVALPDWPPNWLLPERSGSVLRFVESQATTFNTEAEAATRIPGFKDITLSPMSLRQIFLATAKSARNSREGN